jgi:curli production assembly/transport component CsgF
MRLWIYLGLVVVFSPPVAATEMVHRFVDPNFGGNPLNGNFLMTQASGQDNNKESVPPEKTELQLFTENFQSSILNGLADVAAGNLIGADGNLTPNSTIRVGNFSVSVSDVINGGVSVSISDGISNTVLTVPRINSQ